MRSLDQIVELPVDLRRELSVYYLPTSVWARDRLVAMNLRSLGDVQNSPEAIEFMIDADIACVRQFMSDIGLPLKGSVAQKVTVPRQVLESILTRLSAIEKELKEALR